MFVRVSVEVVTVRRSKSIKRYKKRVCLYCKLFTSICGSITSLDLLKCIYETKYSRTCSRVLKSKIPNNFFNPSSTWTTRMPSNLGGFSDTHNSCADWTKLSSTILIGLPYHFLTYRTHSFSAGHPGYR